jgi:hypothetical protein
MSNLVKAKRSLPVLPTGKPVTASMSKTDLLLLCQWFASPLTPLPKQSGETAVHLRFGTAFHKLMELLLLGIVVNSKTILEVARKNAVEAARLEHFFRRGKEFMLKLLKERGWTKHQKLLEQKIAYDPFKNTVRKLLSKKERDYSGITTTEFPGTGDLGLIPPTSDQPLVVLDYKTGSSDYEVEKNGQLKSLGIGMSLMFDNPNCIAIIMRIDEDFIEPYETELGPDDWEKHRAGLRNAIRLALSKHPPIRPGEHCKKLYCNALEICPAHAGPFALGDAMHGLVPRDQLGPLFARFQAAKKLVELVGDRFKREIEMNGAFPTEEGRAELVHKSKRNLSEASIRRAFGAVDAIDVIKQLEDAGAIEQPEWDEIRVVKDGK